MTTLKEKVDEFATIAKSLPENLQVVCFDLLLRNHLERAKLPHIEPKLPPKESSPAQTPSDSPAPDPADTGTKQEDLKDTDLHLKARKFLQKYVLSVDHLNNLYFKENDELKTLYEDLKTVRTSESQIRITLLQALQNAISTGEFETDAENVRKECMLRKCYDVGNFSANYNNKNHCLCSTNTRRALSPFDFQKTAKGNSPI
jgi:hypothetical protein